MNKHLDKFAKLPMPMKLGGVAGIAVLVTVANALLVIHPVEEQITKSQTEQRSLDQTLLEKKAIAKNLNDRRQEMAQLERQLQDALAELPEKKEIDELLTQLNDVGRKSGLEISKIEPGKEAADGFYAKIPINIVVKGNYHEIAMFMQEISNLRRIVNVSGISLGDVSTKGDKVMLDSKFVATTFRFLEKAEAPNDPKAARGAKKAGKKG